MAAEVGKSSGLHQPELLCLGQKSTSETRTILKDLEADRRRIGYKLPLLDKRPRFNYTNIHTLCQIDGLSNGSHPSTPEAHTLFMKKLPTIFKQSSISLPVTSGKTDGSNTNPRQSKPEHIASSISRLAEAHKPQEEIVVEMSHEISDHLAKLHKQRSRSTQQAKQEARINIIRKILKKLPFERTKNDIRHLCRHLRHFDCFMGMPDSVLLGLCAIGQLETWEEGFTMPGNQGMYVILSGSASPQLDNEPHDTSSLSRSRSGKSISDLMMDGKLQHIEMFRVGDHFGTLERLSPGFEQQVRVESAVAIEPCEVLIISTVAFQRVIKHVAEKEAEEKFQLVHNCKMFIGWPTLSLKRVSSLLKWLEVDAGEVLADEGTVCDVVCFIKTGFCKLKKTLSVAFVYPDGRKVKKNKKLVVGTLGPGDSFGEQCVLGHKPVEHAIVSKTPVTVGYLDKSDIEELDEVTTALFTHTYEDTEKGTSEEIIEKQYVERQSSLEWKNQKDRVLNETLYYRGIIPGYSKWKHCSISRSSTA